MMNIMMFVLNRIFGEKDMSFCYEILLQIIFFAAKVFDLCGNAILFEEIIPQIIICCRKAPQLSN